MVPAAGCLIKLYRISTLHVLPARRVARGAASLEANLFSQRLRSEEFSSGALKRLQNGANVRLKLYAGTQL